ncbi:MAG: hypothetical protein LBU83_12585 [Bacteroidales bacterium]|jgi:hypothetical protein|nr:hypothetical protein [Bacteroidales bacterium]
MKKGLIVLLLVFLSIIIVSPVFAERTGALIGTFGVGFSTYSFSGYPIGSFSQTLTALSVDLDIVSRMGLAISTGNMMNFIKGEALYAFPHLGLGYRYLAEKWDLGASVIVIPIGFGAFSDALVGAKISGGFWITRSFGLNLTMMFGGAVYNIGDAFSMRLGFSVRLQDT